MVSRFNSLNSLLVSSIAMPLLDRVDDEEDACADTVGNGGLDDLSALVRMLTGTTFCLFIIASSN